MTTIVNTPPASNNSGGNVTMIVGFVALIIVAYLFSVYGLPAIQHMQLGTPQVTIPAKIDVTVNQPK